jgi:beta-glucosidase
VQRVKAEGMNVIGYNYWSITNNYERGSDRPRLGLYTVDAVTDPTLTRSPTVAVPVYRRLIADGGVPDGYRLIQGPLNARSRIRWSATCSHRTRTVDS